MITNRTKEYLKFILRYAEQNEDVDLWACIGYNDVEYIGLPRFLGIDEFALCRDQMIDLLELDEAIFDSLFGPKIHLSQTIERIKALL